MAVAGNSPASRDIAYLIHPYTNLEAHKEKGPVILAKGKGIKVWDDEGKEYIEGLAGLWCTALGYGEERLVQAAATAMRNLAYTHIFAGKSHPAAIDLAERLVNLLPEARTGGKFGKVFFANSGSEANDTVIKLVWYVMNGLGKPEKKKIIARNKGYHGVTLAAASLTGLPHLHAEFDLPIANILHTTCPHYYRFGAEGESEEEFATRCADDLDKMIRDEGPETVAAFIAEPVMGAGGVIPPPKTYFEKIQKVLDEHDVLMIADEVICGFGRTGGMFGCDTYGIRPDIVSVAKQITSAYLPLSAVAVSQPLADVIVAQSDKVGTFGMGYTYSAHPVAAAVAIETLKIYEDIDMLGHVRGVSPRFQKAFAAFADSPIVGEYRGVGLIGACELVANKKTKEPFDPVGKVGGYMAERAEEHGLILRNMGDAVALCPPMIVTAKDIDEIMERFGKALKDTEEWVREEGLLAA